MDDDAPVPMRKQKQKDACRKNEQKRLASAVVVCLLSTYAEGNHHMERAWKPASKKKKRFRTFSHPIGRSWLAVCSCVGRVSASRMETFIISGVGHDQISLQNDGTTTTTKKKTCYHQKTLDNFSFPKFPQTHSHKNIVLWWLRRRRRIVISRKISCRPQPDFEHVISLFQPLPLWNKHWFRHILLPGLPMLHVRHGLCWFCPKSTCLFFPLPAQGSDFICRTCCVAYRLFVIMFPR